MGVTGVQQSFDDFNIGVMPNIHLSFYSGQKIPGCVGLILFRLFGFGKESMSGSRGVFSYISTMCFRHLGRVVS